MLGPGAKKSELRNESASLGRAADLTSKTEVKGKKERERDSHFIRDNAAASSCLVFPLPFRYQSYCEGKISPSVMFWGEEGRKMGRHYGK